MERSGNDAVLQLPHVVAQASDFLVQVRRWAGVILIAVAITIITGVKVGIAVDMVCCHALQLASKSCDGVPLSTDVCLGLLELQEGVMDWDGVRGRNKGGR